MSDREAEGPGSCSRVSGRATSGAIETDSSRISRAPCPSGKLSVGNRAPGTLWRVTVDDPRDLSDLAEELLPRLQEGSADAWREAVERYGPLVLSVPRELGLTEQECDDVYQSTWLGLMEHARRIRTARCLPAWITSTAYRASLRVARKRQLDVDALAGLRKDALAAASASSPYDPAQHALSLERRRIVHEALKSLSPRCRELVGYLHFGPARTSYAEAGDLVDLAPGSIGPIHRRCLAELARELERRGLA